MNGPWVPMIDKAFKHLGTWVRNDSELRTELAGFWDRATLACLKSKCGQGVAGDARFCFHPGLGDAPVQLLDSLSGLVPKPLALISKS